MNSEAAGTTKKNLLSQQDYLAPLPIPTGEKPVDMANMIWRKNDVFLDIGNFNVGGVMVLWCAALFYLCLGLGFKNIDPEVTKFAILSGLVIVGIPTLVFIYNLSRPTPLPIRFIASDVKFVCLEKRVNIGLWLGKRSPPQHRSILQSVSQAGKTTSGMLFISFDNPDPLAAENNKHWMWGFNCGGNEAAMSTWECIRSYMEIGPHVLPESNDFERGRANLKGRGIVWGICCEYAQAIWKHLRDGEVGEASWLILVIFVFGAPSSLCCKPGNSHPHPHWITPRSSNGQNPYPPNNGPSDPQSLSAQSFSAKQNWQHVPALE